MQLPLAHLSRRFFQVVLAKPLSPAEQVVVSGSLTVAEQRLFWSQSVADQRHAFETLRRLERRTAEPSARRAALLHDVGKAAVNVGPLGRVVATLLDAFGIALKGRFAAYRQHGASGAALLEEAGSDDLVVDFARRHPDPDPGTNEAALWRALLDADHV